MANSAHEYEGKQNGRGQRLMSKVSGQAIPLDRLEELIGKSTKVVDPGQPMFKKPFKTR